MVGHNILWNGWENMKEETVVKNLRKAVACLLVLVMVCSVIPVTSANAATQKQFTVSGRTIKPVVKKGKDISKNVNVALKEAATRAKPNKIYTVKIPKGTYYISESMKVRSNTILDATGCTIRAKKGFFNMIATGSSEENAKATGYNTYKNITIKGGTWINYKSNSASGIRFCRGTNIVLKDIDMSHGSEKHMVEMAAVKNVKITGCTFHDSDVKDSMKKCEAIQIDVCANEELFSSLKYDGTACENITIDGNTFENVSRGIGTHSMLLNSYISGVTITNNKFVNVTQEAIACVNYTNCLISDNTMENVGGGILFYFSKTSNDSIYTAVNNGKTPFVGELCTNANSVIENNRIETRYHSLCDRNVGIELYGRNMPVAEVSADNGTIPAADYYVEGVTIRNNHITAAGYGINLNDAKNNQIIGNTIEGANYDSADPRKGQYCGIRIRTGSTGNVINENTVSGIDQTGIMIYDNSSVSTVEGNVVTNCSAFGIRVNLNSQVTQSMKNNTISGCPQGAITVNTKAGCYVEGGTWNNIIK